MADGYISQIKLPDNKTYLIKDSEAARAVDGGYLPLSGGTMTGQIKHAGMVSPWRNGRDNAVLAITTANAYSPLTSIKTENGSWELGAYKTTSNTNYVDRFLITYFSDDAYTNNNNTVSTQLMITKEGALYPLAGANTIIGTSTHRWANIYTNAANIAGTVTVTTGGIWAQGGSAAGSDNTRMGLTSGMPDKFPYNSSKRGTFIYSNAIAFADPLNGNSNNDAGWIRHLEETANKGIFEIAVGDDNANEEIVVRRYNASNTVGKEIKLFDASGNSSFPGVVSLTNTTASTSSTTGALVVSGGIGTGAASYLTGTVHIVGTAAGNALMVRDISGCNGTGNRGTNIDATDQGLYLNLNGGPVLIGYADATAANQLYVQYTGDASSTSTGALRVDGGVGIAKKLYVGSIISAPNFTATHTAGSSSEFKVQYSNTISYWWGVGNGNENHGLYDDKVSKWIILAGAANTWSFDGNATTATTASNLTNFKVTTNTNLGIDAPGTNAIGYVSGLTKADWNYQQSDGALYTQFYSSFWGGEIFQDYRTGQLSVRGKNNNEWQSWRRIADETNGRTLLNITNVSNDTTLNNSSGTIGDIIYWSSANTPARLGKGTAGQFLRMGTANVPVWGDGSEVTLNGTATTTPSFYAPTQGGTASHILKSGGVGAEPVWDPNVTVNANGGLSAPTIFTDNIYQTASWVNGAPTTDQQKVMFELDDSTGSGLITYFYNRYYPESTTSRTGLQVGAPAANAATTTYFELSITADGATKRTYTDAQIYGAVWNDYAEYRKQAYKINPGRVVIDLDNGLVIQTEQRLMSGAQVVSDTFGFAIGENDECKTPLAVSGRVLVYPYRNRYEYHAGMAVCSAPNGTVDIMTREEIKEYPDAIVGIVSEIPQYKEWGEKPVKVDGRIWIKVK